MPSRASLARRAAGFVFLDGASGDTLAAIQAFAAGAILTIMASTMLPEACEEEEAVVGVVNDVGFLVAFVLSQLE